MTCDILIFAVFGMLAGVLVGNIIAILFDRYWG